MQGAPGAFQRIRAAELWLSSGHDKQAYWMPAFAGMTAIVARMSQRVGAKRRRTTGSAKSGSDRAASSLPHVAFAYAGYDAAAYLSPVVSTIIATLISTLGRKFACCGPKKWAEEG